MGFVLFVVLCFQRRAALKSSAQHDQDLFPLSAPSLILGGPIVPNHTTCYLRTALFYLNSILLGSFELLQQFFWGEHCDPNYCLILTKHALYHEVSHISRLYYAYLTINLFLYRSIRSFYIILHQLLLYFGQSRKVYFQFTILYQNLNIV